MLKKTLYFLGILLYSSLIFTHVTASPNVIIEEKVKISISDNTLIVSTDLYEFRFNKDSVHWNVTRKDFNELALKHMRWKLYFNETSIGAESAEYNASNGERIWDNSTFSDGIFLTFASLGKGGAPDVIECFWFYPKYFLIQLNVTHTISGKTLTVKKAEYITDAVPNAMVGDRNNTNFVYWGYKQRYQANEEASGEPPVFIYNNKTDEGLAIAQFKPDWTHRAKVSYMNGSPYFNLLYDLSADTASDGGVTITANNWVAFDKVFFQFTSSDINQAFKDYAAMYASMYTLRPNKGGQAYWLTWFADPTIGGENITEAKILSNATWIRDNLKTYYGFDGVLIDAIITDEVGDWLNYSETRFPSGMSELLNKIHAMGLKVGLWIAPLWVEQDGWISRTHPQSLARNQTGGLLVQEVYYGQVRHDVYFLNPFDPWVQERLQEVNQRISSWGFDFVKLDFIARLMYQMYMENKTRYMVIEQTYEAITSGFDERIVVMSCVEEIHNPAVVVNYVDRVWVHGPDLWNCWDYLIFKYDDLTQLIPFIRHFNTTVDVDALGYTLTNPQIPSSMVEFYATYATVGGGTFEIGEKLSTIDSNRLMLYKRYLPFVANKWRPVEWDSITKERPPRIWLYNATLDNKQHYYVALLNPQDLEVTITIDFLRELKLPTGTYLILNQYNSSYLGEYASHINISLDANQTMILTLTKKTTSPTFLMRSDHVGVSTQFVSVTSTSRHLTVTLSVSPDGLTPIIVYSPDEPVHVHRDGYFITPLFGKDIFDNNTAPCWYYDPSNKLLYIKTEHSSSVTITISFADDLPPVVWEVRRSIEHPEYNQSVVISANITDQHSVLSKVILSYYDSEWHNLIMTVQSNGLYEAEIPSHPYGTTVKYKIYANDTWGNPASSGTYSYIVGDKTPPFIGVPNWIPEKPDPNENVTVTVSANEPTLASGIKNATLWFRTDNSWQPLAMQLENEMAIAIILGQRKGAKVEFYIEIYDNSGNRAVTAVYDYRVKLTWTSQLWLILPWILLVGFAVGIAIISIYSIVRRRKPHNVLQLGDERFSHNNIMLGANEGNRFNHERRRGHLLPNLPSTFVILKLFEISFLTSL